MMERNAREAHAALARSVRPRHSHLAPAPRRQRRSGLGAWLTTATAIGAVLAVAILRGPP